jgi:hypothetical protein
VKKQPPYYELDHETRRYVESVVELAEDLAEIQVNSDARNSILDLTQEVAIRLGLTIRTEFKPEAKAEVVPLRPFRVVESSEEEGSE